MYKYRNHDGQTSSLGRTSSPSPSFECAVPATPRKSATKKSSVFSSYLDDFNIEDKLNEVFGTDNAFSSEETVEHEFDRYITGMLSP